MKIKECESMSSIATCLSTKHGQGTLLGDEDIMNKTDPVQSSRNHMWITLKKVGPGEEVSIGFGLPELNAIEQGRTRIQLIL